MRETMMIRKIACLLLLGLAGMTLRAQTGRESIEIDYANPKTYVVGGVGVEGNQYFGENQVLQLTGVRTGMKLTVPGEDVTGIVKRLVAQRFFEDVAMVVDSLNVAQDTAWFKIIVKERPRVSRWTYSGVKSGERKDLQERLNLRPGREFSDYVQRTSEDIIKRYYKEKGYLLCEVDTQVQKDTVIRSAIRVNNFFKSKKFKEKEYQTDRKTVLEAFNEAGYRDARLVRDSVYYSDPKHLSIDMVFDQGPKYYFRNVTWTGNSVYPSEVLDEILQIKKGDIYDMVTMDKRLHGGGKQTDYDVRKLYMDNGYLFFNVTPVEVNIQNDQHRHQRQRPHEREGGPPPDHDPSGLPVQPDGFRALYP